MNAERGTESRDGTCDGMSRRTLLRTGAAAALAPAVLGTVGVAEAAPARSAPRRFPASVSVRRQSYENWGTTIRADGLWTCRPRRAQDVVDIVNWAHDAGWTVRPRGAMHGWSPLVVSPDANRRTRTVLVDTSALADMALVAGDPPAVRVGAGATMLALLSFLESHGLGLTSVPATGDPTVGGALAIGAHGAALPAAGEVAGPGRSFGSLSNLVVEITVVAWDAAAGRYALRTFSRAEPEAAALLVHLGRAFVVDVTLRTGPGVDMRCESFTDIPARELFGPPGAGGRSFASFVDETGRAEAIWFPFTDAPWLKVWSVSERRPAGSREVSGPYNYPFSDSIPLAVARLADRIVRGYDAAAPQFAQVANEVASAGLTATASRDLWGPAKNTQLYIKASTLRVDELGYAIVMRRDDIQRVIALVTEAFTALVEEYRARGSYPMNNPVELRCSGIDDPADAGVPGARTPMLGAAALRPDRPDWDTVLWLNLLTFPDTRDSLAFYRDYERWLLRTFDGGATTLRPEWSKGWAFTRSERNADRRVLRRTIPRLVSEGRPAEEGWSAAHAHLDALDPHRVITNPFLEGVAR